MPPRCLGLLSSKLQKVEFSIFCAVVEKSEGVTGKYFSDCIEMETSEAAKNMEDEKRLWEESFLCINQVLIRRYT